MSGYEEQELTAIDAALDANPDATSNEVFQATRPYDERAIASVAASRALAGGGGSSAVLTASVMLTDAQVKAMPTTPIEILPAQGAGVLTLAADSGAFPALIQFGPTNVAYTNVNAVAGWRFENLDPLAGWQTAYGAHTSLTYGPSGGGTPVVTICSFSSAGGGSDLSNEGGANQPLYLAIDNQGDGDLTGGDPANTCKVTIYYALLTL